MALNGGSSHPRVCQALSAMLCKNALNPADITVVNIYWIFFLFFTFNSFLNLIFQLYKIYQSSDTPPVEFLRIPQFLDLLLDALFKPGSKLQVEHKPKYIFLLAYASSVYETYKKSVRKSVNKDELKGTIQAIEKVSIICGENKGSSELLLDLNVLFQCIRYPVVSLGVILWVKSVVLERNYFQLSTEHTPLHLALLDEVTTCHITLHSKVLELYINLFESPQDDLDVLVQLEMKKMLLDRMVHLLSRGCVVPVINYIKNCWARQDTDMSLIRYFVTEVLDVISPPYTAEFIQFFYPLVSNEEVTGNMRNENENALVLQFLSKYQIPIWLIIINISFHLGHCKSNHSSVLNALN